MRRAGSYVTGIALAAASQSAGRAALAQSPTPVCRSVDVERSAVSLAAVATPPSPIATLRVDGETVDVSAGTCFDGQRYHLDWSGDVGGSAFTLSAEMDPDPFINFSFGVTNFTGVAQSYGLTLQIPIVGAPYGHARGVLSASVTDNVATLDGAALGASGLLPLLRGSASNGGPFASLGVDRGVVPGNGPVPCAVAPGVGAGACPYGVVNSFFAPTPYDALRAQIDFTLTPNQDNVGVVGGVSIFATTAPEPSVGMLLLGGLLAVGGVVRPRRRAS